MLLIFDRIAPEGTPIPEYTYPLEVSSPDMCISLRRTHDRIRVSAPDSATTFVRNPSRQTSSLLTPNSFAAFCQPVRRKLARSLARSRWLAGCFARLPP